MEEQTWKKYIPVAVILLALLVIVIFALIFFLPSDEKKGIDLDRGGVVLNRTEEGLTEEVEDYSISTKIEDVTPGRDVLVDVVFLAELDAEIANKIARNFDYSSLDKDEKFGRWKDENSSLNIDKNSMNISFFATRSYVGEDWTEIESSEIVSDTLLTLLELDPSQWNLEEQSVGEDTMVIASFLLDGDKVSYPDPETHIGEFVFDKNNGLKSFNIRYIKIAKRSKGGGFSSTISSVLNDDEYLKN